MSSKDFTHDFLNDAIQILDAIDSPCSILSKDFTFRFVNKAYEKYYQLPKNEIIGKKLQQFIDKHFFENTVIPHFQSCLSGKKVKFTHHKIDSNNTISAFEIEYYPGNNEKGETEHVIVKINNVTEVYQLKEQLVNSKQKWSNSVNSIDDILIIINTNFEIEDINEAGLKLVKKSRYEVIGKKCYDTIRCNGKPAGDCSICSFESLKNSTEKNKIKISEWYNDENKKYYQVKTAPVLNNKGEIIKYIDLLHDITELKEKELELKESQYLFKSLFRNSLDGVLYIDVNGNIIEANDQLLKILGSPSIEATKAINVFEFEPLINMGYTYDMQRCIKTGKSVFGKNFYKSKWGKELYLKYYFNPIRKNGEIIGVFANVEDKTDEYITKIEKESSDEKYRILANNASDIVIVINYNLDVLYVSPSCYTITGYTPEEFKELKGYDIIYKEDIEFSYQLGRKIMKGESKRSDIRMNKKNTEYLWVDVEGKPITYNNQACILLTARDISDRKRYEEKIQDQNDELRQLNKTKDKLFSIISHDLKNPLNNILGFSRLLINDKTINANEKLLGFINHIHQAADRLHILLENLLNWSRTQLGSIQYIPDEINIQKLVHENLLSAKMLAKNKNIQIENKIPEGTTAYFDKSLISVVIMNLLTNAIKFSHENCFITISSYQKDDILEICVEDHGIGIEEENLPKLFSNENFTTPGTNNEKGTGLGLGIVKEFVELNKGEIWVNSTRNMGTKFYFTLPLKGNIEENK